MGVCSFSILIVGVGWASSFSDRSMGRFFLFVVIAAAAVYALACASRRVFLAICLFKVGSMFKVNGRIYLSQMASGMASGKDLRRCDSPTKRFPA